MRELNCYTASASTMILSLVRANFYLAFHANNNKADIDIDSRLLSALSNTCMLALVDHREQHACEYFYVMSKCMSKIILHLTSSRIRRNQKKRLRKHDLNLFIQVYKHFFGSK